MFFFFFLARGAITATRSQHAYTLNSFSPYSVGVIRISISIFLCCPCLSSLLPGPFLKANFPHRWNTPLPSPSSRSALIEIEMLFPSFPSNLYCSSLILQTSPACYSIYPSSLFSSHWLLMCLPSNLLLVNRPPMESLGSGILSVLFYGQQRLNVCQKTLRSRPLSSEGESVSRCF